MSAVIIQHGNNNDSSMVCPGCHFCGKQLTQFDLLQTQERAGPFCEEICEMFRCAECGCVFYTVRGSYA